MGTSLPCGPDELFQLYIYAVSIVCFTGSDTIFALYPIDERCGKTAAIGLGMEKSVPRFGLGIFPERVRTEFVINYAHKFKCNYNMD